MKVITVGNCKGGVGKSVTALSMTSILCELGYRTLLIDLDPQSNSTRHLVDEDLPEHDKEASIRQVLLGQKELREVLVQPWPNLSFCPSQLRLQNIEKELADSTNPIFALHDVLDTVREDFDYCIFDTQPNTGLMTRAALVASNIVVIPCILERWPIDAITMFMEGVEKAKQAQKYLPTKLEKITILPTFFEERRELTTSFFYALKQGFTEYVCPVNIHRSTEIGKTFAMPLARLEQGMRAKTEYLNLVDELLGSVDGE